MEALLCCQKEDVNMGSLLMQLLSQAGYLLYASLTHRLVFDCRPGDIFGCVADIGWITGHSYVVYGPLANGVTTLLFESTPLYPDPGNTPTPFLLLLVPETRLLHHGLLLISNFLWMVILNVRNVVS